MRDRGYWLHYIVFDPGPTSTRLHESALLLETLVGVLCLQLNCGNVDHTGIFVLATIFFH